MRDFSENIRFFCDWRKNLTFLGKWIELKIIVVVVRNILLENIRLSLRKETNNGDKNF